MSKVRDLPEITSLDNDDLLYSVDTSAGPNGGRKITKANLKESVKQSPAEIKTAYESNADTNNFTDAEKAKLATIEAGAAFQDASEVPYSGTVSGLSASKVQDAIDEVSSVTQADFRPSIVSGRILHYTGGMARFDDVFFAILPGDILLSPSITNGEVYIDLDGLVKQTASGVVAPPLSIVFAKFSTDLNDIISLTDERVKNSQNLVRGLLSDVRDVSAGAAGQAGSSGRLSDAMHKHPILTGAAVTQTPDQANAEGTAAELARADHVHDIPTAAAVGIDASSTNTQGNAATFARSNHTHAVATGAASSISTSSTNAAGTSANLARADHTHAVSISTQEASATVDDTTDSVTDTLMASMTITPASGTYWVSWSGSIVNSVTGAERTWVSIYSGGSQVAATERSIGVIGSVYVPTLTQSVVTVNGSQAVEIRWRVAGGTSTVRQRKLTIMRLSN